MFPRVIVSLNPARCRVKKSRVYRVTKHRFSHCSLVVRRFACQPRRQAPQSRRRAKNRPGNILSFLCRKTPCTGQIYRLSGRGAPGGNALPNSSATYCGRGNDSLPPDGVAFRHPPARGSRFTTPPPGGTSCFTTHRRRSGRRARPNFGRALPGSRPKFGQRYRCDNLSQPLPAGSVV